MALDYSRPLQIPFAAGLNTKGDPRAQQPPQLDICKDVRFDNVGGLETRFPFAAATSNILGGGTISGARRLVVNGSELLLFTSDTLYSWNAQLSVWAPRGTHLAVAVSEETAFGTTGDLVDSDRAELNGTIIYASVDQAVGLYITAIDKATGAVILVNKVQITAALRPRVIALQTKILLLYVDGTGLWGLAIDPANVATSLAGGGTVIQGASTFNNYYDACQIIGTDSAAIVTRRNTTTSYTAWTITAALATTTAVKARACDGPIAVSSTPDGLHLQVIRANGSNIQGDLLAVSALADVFTAQAVGTTGGSTVTQIAAAHRSVQNSGQNRCYVFWSLQEAPTSAFTSKSAWVDTGNALGTQAIFVYALGVASRAFDYNGHVYFWGVFAGKSFVADDPSGAIGQLQNTYYLYRDDAFLAAKSTAGSAGGFSNQPSHLPGVALTSGSTVYNWCGGVRRIVPVGNQKTYAARAPRDITFTFDSNSARRCVRLGLTMYITGGMVMQYDGVQIVELGFNVYPWDLAASISGTGNIANGGYSYKNTYRWNNAVGERDRCTTATVANLTMSGGPAGIVAQYLNLFITKKTSPACTVEFWRTAVNPTNGAPFYLVTSLDPSVTTPNNYIVNDPTSPTFTTFNDQLADTSIVLNETNPENGAVLESLAPPPATIIFATDTRIFLAGIAGSPDTVWYSMQRLDGHVAGFNDALVFNVPPEGGAITAIAKLQGAIVVFRENATYLFANDGFDNTGLGANFTLSQTISPELGAQSAEGVCLEDRGLFVNTDRGYHLLDKSFTYQYIGAPVDAFNSDVDESMTVMSLDREIRILTAGRMLVLDTYVNQWCERTIADGLDAVLWNGTYYYLTATGPRAELATFAGGTTYGMDVETAWIKVNDLQGRAVVRRFLVLGEYRSDHRLRIRVARDYLQDGAGNWLYYDDVKWPATPQVVGGPEQMRHPPSQKRCEAIKVRITAINGADYGFASTVIKGAGATTMTLTALVPGSAGNSITLSNDSYAGPLVPTITIVGTNIALSSALLTTFSAIANAINAAGLLVQASVTGDGTETFVLDINPFTGALSGGFDYPTGEACKLTGLALEVGVKPGTFRGLPAAQKA